MSRTDAQNGLYIIFKRLKAQSPFERAILRCRGNNDNNVIRHYLSRTETKIEVVLKDIFKIQCNFGRPLLHNEPQWAVYYRHSFCTKFVNKIKFYANWITLLKGRLCLSFPNVKDVFWYKYEHFFSGIVTLVILWHSL